MRLPRAHADQLREHGGEHRSRDEGLLDPALARPRQRWSYDPDSDLADLAAAEGSLEESELAEWVRSVMVAAGE